MNELPTQDQLAAELGTLLRYGLGRSPGSVKETAVPRLLALSKQLTGDNRMEWHRQIALAVIERILDIKQEPDRLAIADMFGVTLIRDLPAKEIIEGISSVERVPPLEGLHGRYVKAGRHYKTDNRQDGHSERYVKEVLREKWLEQVAGLLLKRKVELDEAVQAVAPAENDALPPDAPPADRFPSDDDRSRPPIQLVGAVGAVLAVAGVAWLVAAAVGILG